VEIRNHIAFNEADELQAEPIERNTSVLSLTQGIRLIEPGIRLSEDSDCNEQRTATAGQKRVLICFFLAVRIFWRERRRYHL
jgi:hypothetical protein